VQKAPSIHCPPVNGWYGQPSEGRERIRGVDIVPEITSASGYDGPHHCLERVERVLGVAAAEDKSLPGTLPGPWDTLDVLLVNHPLAVNEKVALLEHNLKPRPDLFLN
jgi:hypothetical protein